MTTGFIRGAPAYYYGPLNPDKTFYLIKQPVKENGLTALIANVIGTKQMIRHIRPDFIPVVDLGVAGDPNQFAGTTGEDVWSMFFGKIESVFQNAELYRRAGRAHKMSGIGRERFLRCCDLRLRKRNGL